MTTGDKRPIADDLSVLEYETMSVEASQLGARFKRPSAENLMNTSSLSESLQLL